MMNNKSKGFYLVGFFTKNMRAQVLTTIEKPFETDENGYSTSKCFRSYPRNEWAKEWIYFYNKHSEIKTNKDLRKLLNQQWSEWCKKHHRKYKQIFQE